MEGIIITSVLFISIFGIVYVFLMTRNKERMAMIDKGMDMSLFVKKHGDEAPMKYWVIKIGFLMIGIALGVMAGSLVSNSGMMVEDSAYPSMILLFGGLALVASYFVERKLRAKN